MFPALHGIPVIAIVGFTGVTIYFYSVIVGNEKWETTDTFMTGIYIAILLSHITHFYLEGLLESFNGFLPIYLGYLIVAHSIKSHKQANITFWSIVISSLFIVAEGYLQFKNGISYFGIEPVIQHTDVDGVRSIDTRIQWLGPFSDPNDLALLFVASIPFLLSKSLKFRIFPIICLFALVYGVYITNSRGGVLAALSAVVSYFIIKYRSIKGAILGGTLGLVIFLLGPSRVANISASEDSAAGRIESWYSGYQMFKSSPLFGVGQGMFTDFHHLTAHNSFVLVMAELGLFGLFFFVGIYWLAYKLLVSHLSDKNSWERDSECHDLIVSTSAGLTGILVAMFFLSRSYILMPYFILAVLFQLIALLHPEPNYLLGKNYQIHVILWVFTLIVLVNIVVKIGL